MTAEVIVETRISWLAQVEGQQSMKKVYRVNGRN